MYYYMLLRPTELQYPTSTPSTQTAGEPVFRDQLSFLSARTLRQNPIGNSSTLVWRTRSVNGPELPAHRQSLDWRIFSSRRDELAQRGHVECGTLGPRTVRRGYRCLPHEVNRQTHR